MAIARDPFGKGGERHGRGEVFRIQALLEFVEQGLVFSDQRAFGATLLGAPENGTEM